MNTHNLKVCTWNVCLGAKYKKHHIAGLLREHNIDVLCIQEAEIKPNDDISLLDIQGYTVEIEEGIQMEKRRTMLYIKNSNRYVRQIQTEKPGAHIMLLKIECENKLVCHSSIYRTYELSRREISAANFLPPCKKVPPIKNQKNQIQGTYPPRPRVH